MRDRAQNQNTCWVCLKEKDADWFNRVVEAYVSKPLGHPHRIHGPDLAVFCLQVYLALVDRDGGVGGDNTRRIRFHSPGIRW